jgi:hypothetical protein
VNDTTAALLQKYQDGWLSKDELLTQIAHRATTDNIDALVAGLPEAWQDEFTTWARNTYDNGVPVDDLVYLGSGAEPSGLREGVTVVREWLRRQPTTPRVRDAPRPHQLGGPTLRDDIALLLQDYRDAALTTHDVLTQVVVLLERYDVDAVVTSLPDRWRDTFRTWARRKLDNDIPVEDLAYAGAQPEPAGWRRQVAVVREWLQRQPSPRRT